LAYFENLLLSDWENPYADVSRSHAYLEFREQLASNLAAAHTDRALWRQMMTGHMFPPNPGRDPYTMPDYFGWWQAENAFRRGFQAEADRRARDALRSDLREAIREHPQHELTDDNLTEIAERFKADPALAEVLIKLATEFAQDTAPPFQNITELIDAVWAKREKAYIQFSPRYYPLRSVGGGGFFGLGGLRR
jgi:hypothetical protein